MRFQERSSIAGPRPYPAATPTSGGNTERTPQDASGACASVPFAGTMLAAEMEVACGIAGVALTDQDHEVAAKVHAGETSFENVRAEARVYFASL